MALRPANWMLPGPRPLVINGTRSDAPYGAPPKPTLLFENSYNIPLADYEELLATLDRHFHVVAIEKNGLNNLGSHEPRTIAGHAALTLAFLEILEQEGTPPPQVVVGHSLGFATAYVAARKIPSLRLLVGIAPLLPGKHSRTMFAARMIALLLSDAFAGATGIKRRAYVRTNLLAYTNRFFRNPLAGFALVRDMSRFRFAEEPLATPALLILPTVDELVPRDSWSRDDVLRALPRAQEDCCTDPEHRHSLPLHYGEEIGAKIASCFAAIGEAEQNALFDVPLRTTASR
jgi:pimeloyl-ACP methyl ester carboxylesterase